MASDDASSTRATRASSPFGLLLPREAGAVRWVPLLIGLAVLGGTVVVAEQQYAAQRLALEEATDGALREITGTIDLRMQAQLSALSRLRARWSSPEGIGEAQFGPHAGRLIKDFDYIRSIQWVDPDFVIRWMVSVPGVESTVGRRIEQLAENHTEYDGASRWTAGYVSPVLELISGEIGFAITYPLIVDGESAGYLVGIYEGSVVMESLMTHVATRYDVEITGTMGRLGDRRSVDGVMRYARSADVSVGNQTWTVTVSPSPAVVRTYLTPLPAILLMGGIVVAFLLTTALRSAWMGRLRNQRLRVANSRLAREVTRRTQAEVAEKAARDELASVVNSLPAYVWSTLALPDGTVKVRYQSRFIEVISGHTMHDLEKHTNWGHLVHPEDRERVRSTYRALIRGDLDEAASEYRIVREGGEVRFIRQRVSVTQTHEGRRLDGVALDFTDQRRAAEERAQLESRIQETQRLESLGGLAGGIAHDFNNLLVAMLGHASLAREDLDSDHPAQRSLTRIERAARRAADLCKQMLAYAGMGSVVEERVDLRDVVDEMQELLRASIPSTIALEVDVSAEPVGVEADPSQLRQVVLNLITNAAEAIGDGPGRVDIHVAIEDVDRAMLADVLLGETLEPGRYVLLRVTDDGGGMEEETRRRLFEPFYSTKFQGRGLGLAAVLGIVRRYRGGLSIASAPGAGTTMTVLLPPVDWIDDIASEAPAAPARPLQTDLVGGRVLLVEDDEAARDFAATVLERRGLHVDQASDGVEGLEFFEKHHHQVQCVVLDLTMPRMDGVETARRMRALDPDIPLILSSGYPEADALARFGALGIAHFLQKPYEPSALADAVRVAIHARVSTHSAAASGDA